eukprot:13064-Chlamydomonas_euryale.AAC.1
MPCGPAVEREGRRRGRARPACCPQLQGGVAGSRARRLKRVQSSVPGATAAAPRRRRAPGGGAMPPPPARAPVAGRMPSADVTQAHKALIAQNASQYARGVRGVETAAPFPSAAPAFPCCSRCATAGVRRAANDGRLPAEGRAVCRIEADVGAKSDSGSTPDVT